MCVNPLIALSAIIPEVLALTAPERSFRNSNQRSYNNGYHPSQPNRLNGFFNTVRRISSHVLDSVLDASTNLVQDAASVVKRHIHDRPSSANTAARGVIKNLIQTAVTAAESTIIFTVADSLRARKYSEDNRDNTMNNGKH
jgi:hypothetical protein